MEIRVYDYVDGIVVSTVSINNFVSLNIEITKKN